MPETLDFPAVAPKADPWIRTDHRVAFRGLPIFAFPTLATAACTRGVLDPQGPVAAAEKTILLNSLGIMLAVVVPVIVGTLVFAWWFRAGNARAKYRPDWEYQARSKWSSG